MRCPRAPGHGPGSLDRWGRGGHLLGRDKQQPAFRQSHAQCRVELEWPFLRGRLGSEELRWSVLWCLPGENEMTPFDAISPPQIPRRAATAHLHTPFGRLDVHIADGVDSCPRQAVAVQGQAHLPVRFGYGVMPPHLEKSPASLKLSRLGEGRDHHQEKCPDKDLPCSHRHMTILSEAGRWIKDAVGWQGFTARPPTQLQRFLEGISCSGRSC